ncbi:MAG: RiPP maturation radical SAM protein 1, partial [Proteobacteria bacterium]|nr:RiPP maturation radical SAM protein 1 [Pseudomonadota bacterium]
MSCDIVFVSMPVIDLQRPNLGLSLLKAILTRAGHSVCVRYPVFSFAERVGLRRYLALSSGTRAWRTLLVGDLVFASTAFPDAPCRIREAAAWMLEGCAEAAAAQERQLRDLARHARELVFDTAAEIVAMRPRIVGCSSTFQQHVASLALLRRIRELDPTIVTMMGGANCETEMGEATHRLFPWVDHVFSGEADAVIEPLCSAIMRGETFTHSAIRSPLDRQGLVDRADEQPLGRSTVARLDTLPPPDFDDYFDALHASCLGRAIDVGLPVETSRGCWWGAKHHCTFCGLNGGGMAFRSKSPEKAIGEMLDLSKRYGVTNLEVVDNILDMRYIGPVTDALSAAAPPLNIFYEVKSNLTPAQVAACARAGVH